MVNDTLNNKNYRHRHKEKAHAHSVVNNAIRWGHLKKQPCEVCGDIKAHAHHEDYSKPLEVKWLCHSCHVKRHIEIKRANGIFPKDRKEYDRNRYREKYIKKPPRESWNIKKNDLFDEAVKLRKQKNSYKEIAKILNISQGTAYKWLNKVSYK